MLSDVYLQHPAIVITVNPKNILHEPDFLWKELVYRFDLREKEWIFMWKANPVLRITLKQKIKLYQLIDKAKYFDIFVWLQKYLLVLDLTIDYTPPENSFQTISTRRLDWVNSALDA